MNQARTKGFTIVELLIVIVIIAILASLTIVAFNQVASRAKYSKIKSDMSSIIKALELYKIDHGRYPNSENCINADSNFNSGWCGWNQGNDESFIPGLAPDYMKTVPNLDPSLPFADSILYRSSGTTNGVQDGVGTYYQIIRFKNTGLSQIEMQDNPNLFTGNDYDGIAWGFKSPPTLPNW